MFSFFFCAVFAKRFYLFGVVGWLHYYRALSLSVWRLRLGFHVFYCTRGHFARLTSWKYMCFIKKYLLRVGLRRYFPDSGINVDDFTIENLQGRRLLKLKM
jgi:hypothetical protein